MFVPESSVCIGKIETQRERGIDRDSDRQGNTNKKKGVMPWERERNNKKKKYIREWRTLLIRQDEGITSQTRRFHPRWTCGFSLFERVWGPINMGIVQQALGVIITWRYIRWRRVSYGMGPTGFWLLYYFPFTHGAHLLLPLVSHPFDRGETKK